MDLSKLPKMASSPPPVPDSGAEDLSPAIPALPVSAPLAPSVSFVDAWISLGVGAFLLLWQPRFLQWLCSRLLHTHFNEFVNDDGGVVPYQTLPEFWSDLGPTCFGLVLILDGVLFFFRSRILIWLGFALTLATTLFNLAWFVFSYSRYGPAFISFLAFVFGVFIATTQWKLLQQTRRPSEGSGLS